MKNFTQPTSRVLSLEKDDPKNIAKMQCRVFLINNGITVLVRFLKHEYQSEKTLWDGERNNGEVGKLVLNMLQELKIVNDVKNWEVFTDWEIFWMQDEFEEKDDCIYFAWTVKSSLIKF